MRRPGGHLGGGAVAALVDGQLDPQLGDRLWDHVGACPDCRDAVEREAWVKNRLAVLGPTHPPLGFGQVIADRLAGGPIQVPVDGLASGGGAAVGPGCGGPPLLAGRRSRRPALVVAGAGSVGAAVLGLAAVSGALDLPVPSPTGAAVNGEATSLPAPDPDPESRRGGAAAVEPAVRMDRVSGHRSSPRAGVAGGP